MSTPSAGSADEALKATSPTMFPGPEISGQPTVVTQLSPTQVVKSPFLVLQHPIINEAYRVSHFEHGVMPLEYDRLLEPRQFIREVGSSPETFTFIISSPYNGVPEADTKVHGTVTAKLYAGILPEDLPEREVIFKRTPGVVDSSKEQWELLMMAVDPKLRRQGLAGYLMEITMREVRRRFDERRAHVGSKGVELAKELWLLITTIKEINESFYLRRGFQTTGSLSVPVGTYGSKTGWTNIHMWKRIE